MFKTHTSVFLLMLGFFMFSSDFTLAESPDKIVEMLQQRQHHFCNLKFDWRIAQEITQPGIEQHDYAVLLQKVAAAARKEAAAEGMVDAPSVQHYVDQEVNVFRQVNDAFAVQMLKTWHFESDSKLTVVGGENQNSPYYMGKFIEYYGQEYGLSVNLSGFDPISNARAQPRSAEVWSCSGDATHLRNPFSFLLLNPEDFAILMGKNPLMMYDIQWQSISTTLEDWKFRGAVDTGNSSPFTIDMTLSRMHGGAPSYVKINRLTGAGAKWSSEYKVLKYVQYLGSWLPSEVEYVYDRPKFIRYKRNWTLQSIKPSKPIKIWLPEGSDLADYRLIGKNLTTDAMLSFTKQQQLSLATYQWKVVKHKLPNVAELKTIWSQLHPGENTPDPEQSMSVPSRSASVRNILNMMLPFVGGIFCVGLGVWMFKQRKVN